MKRTLTAALTIVALAVGPAASAALHSLNGTPKVAKLTLTATVKSNLKVAFAVRHRVPVRNVRVTTGKVGYVGFQGHQYALQTFVMPLAKGTAKQKAAGLAKQRKTQPEVFFRASTKVRWIDKGASNAKPCKMLPAQVLIAFGYQKACKLKTVKTPPTGTTTTTTPTTTTAPPTTTTSNPTPTGPPTVTPPAPAAGASADIALVSIGGAAPDGSSCDVSYTVHNNGPEMNQYLTNRITVTTPAGKSVNTTQAMRTMLGGEQMGLTATVPVDCSTSGTYTLTVEVDYDNQLPESNEQNNIGQTTSNPTTTAYPDLVITGAGVSNCDTAWITVKNQGNGAAPAEPVDLLLRIYNSAQQFAGGQQFDSPALGPGDSQTLSMPYKGDCSGLIITGDADSFSKITESNESNNYWSNQG